MGTVPEAYYQFIMHYAPYFYVIATAMSQDPPAGQKNVTVADGTKFSAGMPCEIKDSAHSEWNEVDSVAGNVVTMKNNLAYTYYVAKGGRVDHGDLDYGKGAFPAAFAVEFLYEAYSATQFVSKQAEILSKITSLADWLLTQQCTHPATKAYGGFKSGESSTQYYSIDAGRVIPALLKAYALVGTSGYLDAAKLAGYTFLYNMQHKPSELSIHDKYYGGFARYVTSAMFESNIVTVTGDWDFDNGPNRHLAETFTPQNTHKIESVKLRLSRAGSPGTILISIRNTTDGKPVGGDLCSGTMDGNTLTTDQYGAVYEIALGAGVVLEAGVQYAIIIRCPNATSSDFILVWLVSVDSYPSGTVVYSADGSTWTIYSNMDFYFEEWGFDYSQPMDIECLYDFIGLQMLAESYDTANKTRYETMMADAVGFLRDGFEELYLWFDPKPFGDGKWHRVGINETEVYDDPVSFALLGLYTYEAWSLTCQRVYNFVQTIRASGQYPAYWPEVCWPGYIDVVTRFPACAYYDAITTGILWKIRKERDPPSFKLAHDVVSKYSDEFLYWGPVFTDYSPITAQKAMANVTWLARMFLNYEEPLTKFTQILNSKGEAVLLYPVRQAVEIVSYGEPLDVLAIVSPVRAEEVLLEAGYLLNDYLAFYTFVPVRNHDKIRRKGEDYEIQTLQPFTYENQTIYFKSIARRLLAT